LCAGIDALDLDNDAWDIERFGMLTREYLEQLQTNHPRVVFYDSRLYQAIEDRAAQFV